MKKHLKYILILVMLIGITIPILKINAQEVGRCEDPSGAPTGDDFLNCKAPNKWNMEVDVNKPPNPLPTPSGSLGSCANIPGTSLVMRDITAKGCASLKGIWTANPVDTSTYKLLEPIIVGGETFDTFNPSQKNAFGVYFNIMLKIFIGLCAVLAVIMIILGGMEYMTSELISSKESGKSKITEALFGLLIALGAYALLNTINPDLLKSDVVIPTTIIQNTGGESPEAFVAISQSALRAFGITNCTGTGGKDNAVAVAQQFIGKTTYSMEQGKRNTISGSSVTLDCSAFVAQVYACAGLNPGGGHTGSIFSSGSATKIDGKTFDFNQLNPGDLVGWVKDDNGEKYGHVGIYIGNGQMIDTQPGGTKVRNVSDYKNRITYVKWP